MKIQNIRELLGLACAAVFFCMGMLLLNPQYIEISSSWDYILLQMLTLLNGLGLCLVLGLLVKNLWARRARPRDELHDEAAEKVIV